MTDSSRARRYRKAKRHIWEDQQCSLPSQPLCTGQESQIPWRRNRHSHVPAPPVTHELPMPCCPASSFFWDSTCWKCWAMHRLKLLLPRWPSQLYHCRGLSRKHGVHLRYGSSRLLSARSPPSQRAMNYPGVLKQTSRLFSQHNTTMALTIFWGTDRSQEKI